MFRNGLYDAARAEFEEAYKILPLPDLLHNLSMVAEQQRRYAEALHYEEQFLTAASHLTHSERTATKSRIAKLREQAGDTAGPSTATRGVEGGKSRTPAGALALIGIGSGMLLIGIGCGAGALVTQNQLESGEPLYQREIDALTARGNGLNYAGISFDVLGGVALVSGSAWAIWARTRAAKPQVTNTASLFSILPQAR
jgi:tetratricopeptide (TPR) repeat protein